MHYHLSVADISLALLILNWLILSPTAQHNFHIFAILMLKILNEIFRNISELEEF